MKYRTFPAAMPIAFIAAFIAAAMPGAAWADGLTGEGALSASQTTGNASATTLGANLKLNDTMGPWLVNGVLAGDYGRTNGVTTTNRQFASAQAGRTLDTTFYVFGRTSDTRDRFSGYDNQFFLGAGVGAHVVTGPKLTWSLEAAPGYQINKLTNGMGVRRSFAAHGASKLGYTFNAAVSAENDTDIGYAKTSTLITNVTSLTAKLGAKLAARMSYEIDHQTAPVAHDKADDTYTKVSLVYGF